MLSVPVKVSVTVTGSGVVGKLAISPSQATANIANGSTNATNLNKRMRFLG